MNPKFAALLVAFSLAGGVMPEAVSGLFAEPEPGAGGGGGDNEKKFTQADLDTAITARLARESKAVDKKIADATKTATDKAAALEAQLADITAKLDDAGKNDGQKELAKLTRELTKAQQSLESLTKERDDAILGRDAATAKHNDHVVGTKLTEALLAAKVLPSAIADAVALMKAGAKVDVDDDGTFSITIGKRVYDDPAKAAADWLDSKPHLKSHPGGGTGTKNNGGGGKGALAGDEMDERVLLEGAARELVKQHVSRSALSGD